MSPSITNTMRRFSRGSSVRNSASSAQNTTGASAPLIPNSQPKSVNSTSYTAPLGIQSAPNGGIPAHTATTTNPSSGLPLHGTGIAGDNSRPISEASNSSFDFMNRPISGGHGTHQVGGQVPTSAMGALSRTDQVVLRYFWEDKYAENAKRDLHFVSRD